MITYRCDCCLRDNPPNMRGANKLLMGDWIDHICGECMGEWYESGETDPVVIRAAVLAKVGRAPTPPRGGGEG